MADSQKATSMRELQEKKTHKGLTEEEETLLKKLTEITARESATRFRESTTRVLLFEALCDSYQQWRNLKEEKDDTSGVRADVSESLKKWITDMYEPGHNMFTSKPIFLLPSMESQSVLRQRVLQYDCLPHITLSKLEDIIHYRPKC